MARPLTRPQTYEALCAVFETRGSVDGLAPEHALESLRHIKSGTFGRSEHHNARDFLGGNGLITRFGFRDSLTLAGRALLRDAGGR